MDGFNPGKDSPADFRFCFYVAPDLLGGVNVDLGIWNKLTRVVVVLCVVAALIGVGLWYLPVIQKNERMRREVQRLDTQIQKEEEAARLVKASIDALRNDPKAVERLARQLGYAKPGETVVRFEDPAVTNAAPH